VEQKIVKQEEIGTSIFELLLAAGKNSILISPFLTDHFPNSLQALSFSDIPKARLVVRARRSDFLTGNISVSAIRKLSSFGWEVRFNYKVHAKLIMNSDGNGILGSCNLTFNGLTPYPLGNLELAARVYDQDNSVRELFEELWTRSETFTEDLLQSMPLPIEELDADKRGNIRRGAFTLLDIPQSKTLKELDLNIRNRNLSPKTIHDVVLLGLSEQPNLEKIRANFLNLPIIIELTRQVGDGVRFGTLRAWLESNVIDVPTPSREEFNTQLNRLYALFTEANASYIRIRPSHTEFLVLQGSDFHLELSSNKRGSQKKRNT
jgi:hypothetical protein